jgi:hypothetical protein
MRRIFTLLAFLTGLLGAAPSAWAGMDVRVDLSTQRMTVSENGRVKHVWTVSSGRPGFRTPTGSYRPQRLARMHYSQTYDLAPMPHSIFFHGGYAIHGTGEVRRLGRTASHGCIRLPNARAAELFRLVQAHGAGKTRIVITGDASLADARPTQPETLTAGRAKPSRALAASNRADARRIAKQERRAPRWEREPVYGYAPVEVDPFDGFWAPRGYHRR